MRDSARYYDPNLGRFISADTIIPGAGSLTVAPSDPVAAGAWGQRSGGPGNPQQLNRYSYVLNNPVRNTDPTGHDCGSAEAAAESPLGCSGGGSGSSVQEPIPPCGTGCGYGKGTEESENASSTGSVTARTNEHDSSPVGVGGTSGGSNWSGSTTGHPNAKNSPAPNHVYEIQMTDNTTGVTSVYKYGISAKPLNPDGSSPRANDQLQVLNGLNNGKSYTGRVLGYNVPGRTLALKIEQALVNMYASNNPAGYRGPPGNTRPRPTPR